MKKFKNWYMEQSGMKTRLAIFDFDGTIANVPEKPGQNDPRHGWDGKDWWGSEDSLKAPHYPGGVNHEVVEAFKAAKADPNTHAILLTGRRGVIAHGVRDVLRQHGLYGRRVIDDNHKKAHQKYRNTLSAGKDQEHPDEADGHEEYFSGDMQTHPDYPLMQTKKGMRPDGSTFAHKKFVLENLYKKNGGFKIIEIWDDRQDHIKLFRSMGQEMVKNRMVEDFIIHQVYPPQNIHGQATVVTTSLAK